MGTNGRRLFALIALLATVHCGGGGSTSPSNAVDASATLSFTVAPIDPASIQYIVPLGNMGPWAHTLPTDHAYIYHPLGAGSFAPITVLAPGLGVGSHVTAGQVFGTSPGIAFDFAVIDLTSTQSFIT
ncbi:MAG: hypothetical protein WCQ64_11875, partial [Acidobacteriota bacterium]